MAAAAIILLALFLTHFLIFALGFFLGQDSRRMQDEEA